MGVLALAAGVLVMAQEGAGTSEAAAEEAPRASSPAALDDSAPTTTAGYFLRMLTDARDEALRIGRKVLPGLAWIVVTLVACKLASLAVTYLFNLTGVVTSRLQRLDVDVRRVNTVSRLIKNATSYVVYFAGFVAVAFAAARLSLAQIRVR